MASCRVSSSVNLLANASFQIAIEGAGLVALSAINGGLNDYLDSVALSRKYIKGNPFQKAHLQPFLYI
jgi:hypothetical protein